LQSSWIVILLGAELSFANQNFLHYELESIALNVSQYQKRALMIMILHMIIRNFIVGDKPIGAETIANHLNIPVRLSRDILQDLTNVKLIAVLHENEHKERLYQPALDINKMTISFVFNRLDKKGINQIVTSRTKDYNKVVAILDKFDKMISKSDSNILIRDL
jgi:membrane protein